MEGERAGLDQNHMVVSTIHDVNQQTKAECLTAEDLDGEQDAETIFTHAFREQSEN